MISPRAYLQARGTISDEKTTISSRRRRSSNSPSRKAPSATTIKGLRYPANLYVKRPAPTPITTQSPSAHDGPVSASKDQDIASLLARQISQPVTIPAHKALTTDQVPKSAPLRRGSRKNVEDHERAGMPPAVAALLATTAIPLPKARPGRLMKANSSMTRRVSIEQLRNEWRKDTSAASSLGNGSPLDFLLEPSDHEDVIHILPSDSLDMDDRSFTATSRSVSSESIMSTPSLDHEISTFSSLHGSLLTSTPSPRRNSKSERKVCSPPAEKCHEHPLLLIPVSEESTPIATPVAQSPPSTNTALKSRFKFTSNLTLSFQALRSAAKSFSNFTAPSVPSDDFLTRSLFASQRYASEMRPKSFDSIPDPAVRRYFNPTPALSSPDFHSMLTDALGSRVADQHSSAVRTGDSAAASAAAAAPMIPMQTYSRNHRKSRRASVERDDALSAASAPAAVQKPMTRPREPRENSDFLRVIVLEMNMRRVGKLDAKSGGRARIWLPPRQSFASSAATAQGGAALVEKEQKVVPSRWIAITIEDD